MKKHVWLLVGGVVLSVLPSFAAAQNVSGYGMMPDPFLFLIREPAVQEELKLTAEQKSRLVKINQTFDGRLLANRNAGPEKSPPVIHEIMAESRKQTATLFSTAQQNRLRQITCQLRGISFVLLPHAMRQLQLTTQQKSAIESIVKKTEDEIRGVQSETYEGEKAHQNSQKTILAARRKEQQSVLRLLRDRQKRQLPALLGTSFDASKLGHVRFKAPDFSTGDKWINSKPLRLADLRGKVVALHFWAFG